MTSLIKQWKQTWCHFDSLMTDMQVSTKYIYTCEYIYSLCFWISPPSATGVMLEPPNRKWQELLRLSFSKKVCQRNSSQTRTERSSVHLQPDVDSRRERSLSLSLSPSGPWTQVFLISCMTAMVVLWPKMKAPQINVTTPQTVRTTLDRREESLTFDLNCESFSDLVIQNCNNNSSPQGGNKVISVAKMFVYHTGLVLPACRLHASSSLQSKDSDAFTVVRKRTKCHIIHFWLNLHEARFFIWKLLLCLCHNWLLILRLAFGNN